MTSKVKATQDWRNVVLVALITCLSGCKQQDSSEEVDALVIQQPSVDLGEIEPIAVIQTTITVTNQSNKPVELSQLKLGCYCMESDFVTTELGPGQEYECNIQINDPVEGLSIQNGQFLTAEPADIEPAFSIRYHVKPRAYLQPSVVHLGEFDGSTVSWPIQKELKIEDFTGLCELAGAITVSPANTNSFSCPFDYSISALSERFETGAILRLNIIKKEGGVGGVFLDKLRVHIPSSSGEITLSFIVSGVYH